MKIKFYLLMLPLLCATLANATIVWDGNSLPWTAGSGTEADPYLIETPQHLAWLSDMLTAKKSNYAGAWFRQTDDFDMNAAKYTWVRIGSESYTFQGNYDGDSHTITNITDGVFGYVENSIIKNLTISNAKVKTVARYWGALLSHATNSVIYQCYSRGDITFVGTYSSYTYVGGLMGSCSVSTITRCGYDGNISQTTSYSTDGLRLGGLIGSAGTSVVQECYHIGLTSAMQKSYVGGLTGTYYSDTIINCYVVGDISAAYGNYGQSGGITTDGSGDKNTYITNCYCASKVSGYKHYPLCPTSNSVVKNSYRLDTSSDSSAGTQRDENQMKSPAFPVMLNGDGEELFIMDKYGVNGGYPILTWQEPEDESIATISTLCDEKAGTISGAGKYTKGLQISLSITVNPGYEFKCWSDGNTDNPRQITVTENANYTAIFYKTAFDIHIHQNCTSTVE